MKKKNVIKTLNNLFIHHIRNIPDNINNTDTPNIICNHEQLHNIVLSNLEKKFKFQQNKFNPIT